MLDTATTVGLATGLEDDLRHTFTTRLARRKSTMAVY